MPRPISYAVFCLKKKTRGRTGRQGRSPSARRESARSRVRWRGRDDDERDERGLAVVDEAVLDSRPGDHRLARLDSLLVGAHAEATAPLEHVVDLVLVHVAVRLLGLARRDAVEV